ncbi:hypothetical protein [Desulfocapsa sulfexigens]|uniref:hypothetical protein n=1 Tax=Desulfocapsa sulfexigens TaxID=65555 RepID=UPI003898F49C
MQIDILSVDNATVFGSDILTTDEDTSVTTTVTELLANDSDVEGPLSLCFQPAAINNLPLY